MTEPHMTVILGTQWGDEGKGKVVDQLASRSGAVCRYQGGHNAGHTLNVNGEDLVLHLVPAGALYPQVLLAIGQGTVVSLADLAVEIDSLAGRNLDITDRLLVDPHCHLVLPSHSQLDVGAESRKLSAGVEQIGTTGKGIGPTYEDRVARRGIRFGDLTDEKHLEQRLRPLMERHNFLLKERYGANPMDWQATMEHLQKMAERMLPLMADVPARMLEELAGGKSVILEGAQGYLLDVDRGSYPFVTSSSTCAANAIPGAGLPPTIPLQVLGVTKAYLTRVGSGPFPTELDGPEGTRLRTEGHEHGATTGRPRRCGWLDAVLLRKAVRQNALAGLVVTKLDVLDNWDEIRIAADYRCDKDDWQPEEIEWLTLPGWSGQVAGCRNEADLPDGARRYLQTLEELAGAPVVALSTGPGRDDWIELQDPLQTQLSCADVVARYTK